MRKKGFTLLEVLFSLFIFSIIISTFFYVLNTCFKGTFISFNLASKTNENTINTFYLKNKFQDLKSIEQVSGYRNKQGYIELIDKNNMHIAIYLNSTENQFLFGENKYPWNSLIIKEKKQEQIAIKNTEIFKISLFAKHPINNLYEPINIDNTNKRVGSFVGVQLKIGAQQLYIIKNVLSPSPLPPPLKGGEN